MATYTYKIREEFDGLTVLEFLTKYKLGNEKIKEFKLNGSVFINGVEAKSFSRLSKDDTLSLVNTDSLDIKGFKAHLDIIYEDDYLLIINKPVGCVVHSDGALNQENTLANMVAYYYEKKKYDIPVRYLHRLDYDTTGIIVFCKDILSMSYLSDKLASHDFRRDYLALVSGDVKADMTIDFPIGRDRHVNGKYRVSKTGKPAITHVKVLDHFKKYTLVRLSLETGRTHQIRVHMAYKGNPLLGDSLYGGGMKLINRQALHSYFVSFLHPITGKNIELSAKIPYDMKKLINK